MQATDRKPIRFDKRNKAICDNGLKLKGVTALLKQSFYPDYVYTRNADTVKRVPVIGKQIKRIKGSQRAGTLFDSKVGKSIALQQKYKLTPEVFWNLQRARAECKAKSNITAADRRAIVAISQRKHPFVQRFWRLIHLFNWQPVGSQVPVRHQTARIGTMIDVVCKDQSGKIKLIELKTGFEDYYHTSSGNMLRAPFASHTDCPHNQHQLQVAASQLMYRQTHKEHSLSQSLILRFHSSGIEVVPVQSWATDSAPELFAILHRCIQNQR